MLSSKQKSSKKELNWVKMQLGILKTNLEVAVVCWNICNDQKKNTGFLAGMRSNREKVRENA